MQNLESGVKENERSIASRRGAYESAKKDTLKARAYLLGGVATVGAAGGALAMKSKKKKDNEILDRINTQHKGSGDQD
jgi:hypothetical protein